MGHGSTLLCLEVTRWCLVLIYHLVISKARGRDACLREWLLEIASFLRWDLEMPIHSRLMLGVNSVVPMPNVAAGQH